MMAFFMRPLHFYIFVYFSTMTSVLCSILGTSIKQFNLTMKSQNFEYILSWEAGNNAQEPRYYNVMYMKDTSDCLDPLEPDEPENSSNNHLDFQSIKECSNITHLFCNLTNELRNPCKQYFIQVKTFPEYAQNYSIYQFLPYIGTCLGPPEFNISACSNCVNVSVKILPSLLNVYKKLDYAIKLKSVDFEEQVIEKKNTTKRGSFNNVFEGLNQSTNYCVSVDLSSSVNKNCAPSPWKCIVTSSKDKSGHVTPILCGILVSALGFPVLFVCYYICGGLKSEERPKVLEAIHKLNYSLFDSNPDEVHTVQMIQERWKTVDNEYSYDNKSGDGKDAMYTTRRPLGTISKSYAKAEIKDTESTGCSSIASDCQTPEVFNIETEVSQDDIKKEDSTTDKIFYPPEMNNTSILESEDCSCLNINLNTVKLELSGTNWDALAPLVPFQEDTSDLHEPRVSDASEPKHFANVVDMQSSGIHDPSHPWQNYSGSEESESSDSEMVGEYMRR